MERATLSVRQAMYTDSYEPVTSIPAAGLTPPAAAPPVYYSVCRRCVSTVASATVHRSIF